MFDVLSSSSLRLPSFILVWLLLLLSAATLAALAGVHPARAAGHPANKSESIPMGQLGIVAGKHCQDDSKSVSATPAGAGLPCVFQRLEGQVTSEGLWLTSTAENATGERFRFLAVALGRAANSEPSGPLTQASPRFPLNSAAADVSPLHSPGK